jgi:hypothetical protein
MDLKEIENILMKTREGTMADRLKKMMEQLRLW